MLDAGFVQTVDGEQIAYNHYNNDHSKVIVIVHGFYNSKDSELIDKLNRRLLEYYDVISFDLRGHGESSGKFSWTSKEERDLSAILEYVDKIYEKKAVIAFSMGAVIAINLLSKNRFKIDSLICVSPLSDPNKVDYKWWELDWENDVGYGLFSKEGAKGKGVRAGPFWLEKEKPSDVVAYLDMPVMYIHGSKDWVVDTWHSELLFERTTSKKELVIIEGGPHAEYLIRKNEGELVKAVEGWLEKTL